MDSTVSSMRLFTLLALLSECFALSWHEPLLKGVKASRMDILPLREFAFSA